MNKIRFRYSKTGRAKYISHLDLMSTLQRSFRRAGVDLKYSEGFNPHPYMSVALPLSVGHESLCELMDVAVVDDPKPDIKAIKLPEGIVFTDVYVPGRKFSDISWIEINVVLKYNRLITESFIDELKLCLGKESIVISKRTKRDQKDMDIAPYIKDVNFGTGKDVSFNAKISAQNPTINADDLINALGENYKPDQIDIRRVEIYDANMIVFK